MGQGGVVVVVAQHCRDDLVGFVGNIDMDWAVGVVDKTGRLGRDLVVEMETSEMLKKA